MRVRNRPLFVLLAAAMLLSAVHAAAAEPGRRIRVAVPGQRSIIGTLQAMDATALTVKPDGSTGLVTLDRARISRLEVSQRSGRPSSGAAGGFVAGGLLGAMLGLVVPHDICRGCLRPPNYQPPGRASLVLVTSAIFGVLGAAIGAAVRPGEKWEVVSFDRLHVSVAPARGRGVRMAVSVGF
jgi:hypothetical protein